MLKCAINIFNVFTYTPIQIHQCYFILLYFFALDPLELSKQLTHTQCHKHTHKYTYPPTRKNVKIACFALLIHLS